MKKGLNLTLAISLLIIASSKTEVEGCSRYYNDGQVTYRNRCEECSSGYIRYMDPGNESYKCAECIKGCNICQYSNLQECVLCFNGYFLREKQCESCLGNCFECKDELKCDTCSKGFFLNGDKTKCLSCVQGCSDCENESECKVCFTKYFLNGSTKKCESCLENCSSCNDKLSCSECSGGYKVEANKCVEKKLLDSPVNLQFILALCGIILLGVCYLVFECCVRKRKNKN